MGTQAAAYLKVATDDAFIFYRYANNIASGNGYVFNIGERVLATTSPLYTLALASGRWLLGWLPMDVLPVLGSLISAVSMAMIAMIVTEMFQQSKLRFGALVVGPILLTLPPFWSGVGMDVLPAVALGLAAMREYGKGRLVRCSVSCALAILARPDMACVLVLLLWDWVAIRHNRTNWSSLVVFLVIIGAWLLFSLLYFNTIEPTSLSTKIHQASTGAWGDGYVFLKNSFRLWPFHSSIKDGILILFFVAVVLVAVQWRKIRAFGLGWLVLSWVTCHMLVYGVVIRPAPYPWYYVPLALGIGVVLALAVELVATWVQRWSRALTTTFMVVCLALAAVNGLRLSWDTLRSERHYKWRFFTEAAAYLNERAPDGAVVACTEIGVLGYYYERGPILDLLGLVSPEVVENIQNNDFSRSIRVMKPQFVISKAPPNPVLENFVHEEWFLEIYTMQAVFGTERTKIHLYSRHSFLP